MLDPPLPEGRLEFLNKGGRCVDCHWLYGASNTRPTETLKRRYE
jgi:hypothetical protein